MKPLVLISLLCAVTISVFAQTSHENTEVQQQIMSVLNHQIEGWNEGNIDSFMKGYAASDSLRFASGGTVTYGWSNMLERYKKSYPSKETMGVLTFSNITVDIVSDDAALVFGKWTLKREKDEPWGLFTLLFKNKSGVWRIVHDHTSSGN